MQQEISLIISAAVNYRKKLKRFIPDAFVIAVKRQQNITFATGYWMKKMKLQNMILNEKDLKRN